MSKILRRPMFRGGPVDSRGTGITSGLMDTPKYAIGGRVGYESGELVTGLDLNPSLTKPLEIKPINTTKTPKFKGQTYYEEKEEAEAYVPKYQTMEDFDKAYKERIEKERENVDTLYGTEFGTATFEDSEQKRLKYLESEQGRSDFIAKEQAKQDKKIQEVNKYRDKKIKTSKEMFRDEEPDVPEIIKTEEPTVNPKDLINENKELFKELLGADKARGQDISDMLLRFAGAPGSTTQEKFETYLQAESQAGKGRLEKINETAAALAINDYVAGKRSKEQIESLKEVAKYKGSIAKGSIGAQILEQAKGGTVTSGMIEQVIKGNYPGSNVQKFPKGSISEGTIEIGKDDEGTFIIEEETKKAFFIRGGKPVPIY